MVNGTNHEDGFTHSPIAFVLLRFLLHMYLRASGLAQDESCVILRMSKQPWLIGKQPQPHAATHLNKLRLGIGLAQAGTQAFNHAV